jgi:hypothetical protein
MNSSKSKEKSVGHLPRREWVVVVVVVAPQQQFLPWTPLSIKAFLDLACLLARSLLGILRKRFPLPQSLSCVVN